MLIIRDLMKQMEDELEGAREYAECALKFKESDKELADLYIQLARTELEHHSKLHNQVTRIISKYRTERGEPPVGMQEIYDWQHTKAMNNMAEVKVLVDSYKQDRRRRA